MNPGEIFAERYRIVRAVGQGSFGIVYLATELTTGAERAIKVLLPWTKNDRELMHRLQREARLTQMLHSRNTVHIYELGATPDGSLFVVMEYLRGSDLGVLLELHGPFSPERVKRIGEQALDALAEAHALGVIHRDLKPSNILLCDDGAGGEQVKVLDFGIAKVAGTGTGSGLRETTRLTAPGGILGTPAYMSPEQCRGENLTVASDLYSLGIVLYEMLSGRVPFDSTNPIQVMVAQNTQPVPDLPADVQATPLGRAIMRALQKDPAQRFSKASEFAAMLAGREVPEPAAAILAPTAVNQPAPAPAAAPVKQRRFDAGATERAVPVWVYAVAVLVVAAIAGLTYFVF